MASPNTIELRKRKRALYPRAFKPKVLKRNGTTLELHPDRKAYLKTPHGRRRVRIVEGEE